MLRSNVYARKNYACAIEFPVAKDAIIVQKNESPKLTQKFVEISPLSDYFLKVRI